MGRGCLARPRSIAANAVFVACGEVRAAFARDGIDPVEDAALAVLGLALFESDRADIQGALGHAVERAGPESDRYRRLKRQWDDLMASRSGPGLPGPE
jgi:hypothetical protein